MFNSFKPNIILKSALRIDTSFLREHSVMLLLLDIDNTLVMHGQGATQEVIDWINSIREQVKICFISNNSQERVDMFNADIKLDAIAKSGKPDKNLYLRLAEKYQVPLQNICVIGDQLFTDIWGGNRAGIMTVFSTPIGGKEPVQISFKRFFERILFRLWGKNNVR
jgi:HAD superfamily phosphatase (TIGR01668 family)